MLPVNVTCECYLSMAKQSMKGVSWISREGCVSTYLDGVKQSAEGLKHNLAVAIATLPVCQDNQGIPVRNVWPTNAIYDIMPTTFEPDKLELDAGGRNDGVAVGAEVTHSTQVVDTLVMYGPVAPAAAQVPQPRPVATVGVTHVTHTTQWQVALDPVVTSVLCVGRQTLTQQRSVGLHSQMLLHTDATRVTEDTVDDVFAAHIAVGGLGEDVSDAPAMALAHISRWDLVVRLT